MFKFSKQDKEIEMSGERLHRQQAMENEGAIGLTHRFCFRVAASSTLATRGATIHRIILAHALAQLSQNEAHMLTCVCFCASSWLALSRVSLRIWYCASCSLSDPLSASNICTQWCPSAEIAMSRAEICLVWERRNLVIEMHWQPSQYPTI